MPRIAIEYDTEDQSTYIEQVASMVSKVGFESALISSEQIINGGLQGFDAVIFPGGLGAFYGLRNYEDFGDAVRYFVANGGGYMGVCGGAYVAGLSISETLKSICPRTLGLIDAKIVSPPWIKFWQQYQDAQGKRVVVTCKVTDVPHPIIAGYEGQTLELVYSGGPLIKEIGSSVTPLLTYVDSIMPPGDVALCCSVFGKGRVVISSPHPETPWEPELVGTGCQEWLYQSMVSWVSQPESYFNLPFLPWKVKRVGLPYPLIPAAVALGLGIVGTVSVAEALKRKPVTWT